MKNIYETTIIFNITTDYKSSINKLNALCQDFTGNEYEIDTDELGIRKLVYEIKGQKEGYYYQITWMGDKNNATDLQTMLYEDHTILRFLTLLTDEKDDIRLKPKECEQKKPVIDLLDIIYNL